MDLAVGGVREARAVGGPAGGAAGGQTAVVGAVRVDNPDFAALPVLHDVHRGPHVDDLAAVGEICGSAAYSSWKTSMGSKRDWGWAATGVARVRRRRGTVRRVAGGAEFAGWVGRGWALCPVAWPAWWSRALGSECRTFSAGAGRATGSELILVVPPEFFSRGGRLPSIARDPAREPLRLQRRR